MACWKGLPRFTFMPVVVTDFWGFRIKPFEDHVIVLSGMDTRGMEIHRAYVELAVQRVWKR